MGAVVMALIVWAGASFLTALIVVNPILYLIAGDPSGWAQPDWTMPVAWVISAIGWGIAYYVILKNDRTY
jgi:hypothetical protein